MIHLRQIHREEPIRQIMRKMAPPLGANLSLSSPT